MLAKTKVYVFMGMFVSLFSCYLLLLYLFPQSAIARVAGLFQGVPANFVFLVLLFLLITLAFSGGIELTGVAYGKLLRTGWFRFKIGSILVAERYLTRGELREALAEQKLRIGQVLLRAGSITAGQLERALAYQKENSRKLGEILRAMGLTTDGEIDWALSRMRRKLGEILQEKGLITEFEFAQALALQKPAPP